LAGGHDPGAVAIRKGTFHSQIAPLTATLRTVNVSQEARDGRAAATA